MRWRLIGGLFSLKTLLLACVLAPVPATIPTPALAQFQFVIPIPGIQFQGGRRYYGRNYQRPRHTRRGRGSEGRSVASSGSGQSSSGQSSGPVRSSATTGGKVRGTVD